MLLGFPEKCVLASEYELMVLFASTTGIQQL